MIVNSIYDITVFRFRFKYPYIDQLVPNLMPEIQVMFKGGIKHKSRQIVFNFFEIGRLFVTAGFPGARLFIMKNSIAESVTELSRKFEFSPVKCL